MELSGQGRPPMNVFTFQDYRALLHDLMEERRHLDASLTLEQVASVAKVQKSYLSKVFHHRAHLSSDQIFLLSEFFRLNPVEGEYVVLLMEWERCEIPARRQYLESKLQKLKDPAAPAEDFSDLHFEIAFYSDYELVLLFNLLKMPKYQKDKGLLEHLFPDLAKKLQTLLELKLISIAKNGQIETKEIPRTITNATLFQNFAAQHIKEIAKAGEGVGAPFFIPSDPKSIALFTEKMAELLKQFEEKSAHGSRVELVQLSFGLKTT